MSSTAAWLVDAPVVERVQLDEHCWVDVARGLVPAADAIHDELAATVSWQQGRVFRYEKWIDEPRLGAWQVGDARHPALMQVEDWISQRYRVRFDGLALAQYRNGRDSVAWHRDREMKWLDDTVIGVLTLGEQRPWLMRPLGIRRDNPALRPPAYRDRLAAQFGRIALLDAGIERIHVDVDDLAEA